MFWCAITSLFVIYFLVKRLILEKFSIGAAGRWVVISGCDSGFGRLTALRLIKKGVHLFAGCFTQQGRDALESDAEDCQSAGQLRTFQLDITSDESVANAFHLVKKILDANNAQLWGLVNNAGIFSIFGPADWCSIKQYSDALHVNCLGAVRMCHRFLPLLKQAKAMRRRISALLQGRIVTMGSSAGRMHGQFLAPYCVSKFAVEAYSDCLRFELRQFGVSVHILEPGAFKTELLNEEAQNARVDSIWSSLCEDTKMEYGETYMNNFKEAWNSGVTFAASHNLNWVVKHYEHALFSFWPRLRYYTGWDSKFLFIPLSVMPTFMQDLILLVMYKLQPGPSLVPQSVKSADGLLQE